MKLIADIGNTKSKFAVFNNKNMIDFQVFNGEEVKAQSSYLQKLKSIKSVIISTVGSEHLDLNNLFPSANHLILTSQTPLPIENLYVSPESLGSDRIALAVGGSDQFPNQNLLIIDLGTCITLDFVNDKGQYLGGSISPGMALRFASMNNYTNKLPLLTVDKKLKMPKLIGDTTTNSMKTGVILGIANEIKGFEALYNKKYTDLTILFTGGDYPLLEDELNRSFESKKNQIFADPFLTAKGMNVILDYNETR